MLVNSINIINEKRATFESLKDNQYKANKRMEAWKEQKMMYAFNEIREGSDSKFNN